MTGLLTAAAVITTIALLSSSANAMARATASDPHKRGPWGIAHWRRQRNRPLNAHQRRWQTALLSSRDNDARWGTLVDEIQALERLANVDGVRPVPDSHDKDWLDASVANLEKLVPSAQPTPGESAP